MRVIIDIPDEVYNFIIQKGHLPYGVNIAPSIIVGEVMPKDDWINTFIHKFNEDKDYKITDVRDREKLLDELRPK